MRIAVIDLGTNTFQLLIAESDGKHLKKIFKNSIFVMIGKSGITDQIISPDAAERAIEAMQAHRQTINQYGVEAVYAVATSAVRNAENGSVLVERIKKETGISVEVIDGNQEAFYIFEGVADEISLHHVSLIMDIGGGSVEFIIAKERTVLWKRSFEIGGQRLLDQFVSQDPLPTSQKEAMLAYLQDTLQPLWEAITAFNPTQFIGSAGAFDTVLQIVRQANPPAVQDNVVAIQDFERVFEQMTSLPRDERLVVRGMIPERVDMIVPAVCLMKVVTKKAGFQAIRTATASLKEGVAVVKLNLLEKENDSSV